MLALGVTVLNSFGRMVYAMVLPARGQAAAATMAIYFAAGQVAGPVITGALADLFGGLFAGLMVSGGVLFLGALIALNQRDVQAAAAPR